MIYGYVYGCTDERRKIGMGMMGLGFLKEGRGWRLLGFLLTDYLVLRVSLSEEDLKELMWCFVEVSRRRSLKVNANKSKVRRGGLEVRSV